MINYPHNYEVVQTKITILRTIDIEQVMLYPFSDWHKIARKGLF